MKESMPKRDKTRRPPEAGVALLIAIFVLLLVSVVAIALLVSSGTETALGANYRSSSTVYYAAMAGLEEARGRLLAKNPNYFGTTNIPSPFPLGKATYMLNGISSETVAPWDSSNQYYDNEYGTEFGVPASAGTLLQHPPSVWDNNVQGIPGPVYKWVRINAATEQSLFLDVDSDGSYDNTTPIYYDPAHLDSHGNLAPSLIVGSTATAVQVLQITAMAALPNGSRKILQYVVAPVAVNLNFPAALTLDGTNVGSNPAFSAYPFSVPSWSSFSVNGNDQSSSLPPPPAPYSCGAPTAPVTGLGYTQNDSSASTISSAIPAANHGNYQGAGAARPNVANVGTLLPANFQTVAGLDDFVQTLTQNADVVLPGGLTQSDSSNHMPAWMSASNPATVVVSGDITFNGWHGSGYGILLVTGVFTYDPDATWNGIVLVIGKGIMYSHQLGTGQFNGAVLLASTVDNSGNPLPTSSPTLGSPSFSYTSSAESYGIYYNNCWIHYVEPLLNYQVLSFHEIPQTQ
jgi:hypothetical protein